MDINNKNEALQNEGGDKEPSPLCTEILSLSNFLKFKHPKCIPIPLTIGTKQPIHNEFEFASYKTTVEDMWKRWRDIGIHIVTQGHADMAISLHDDIVVIDADDEELANKWNEKDGFKDTVAVKTQKGIHSYFLRTPEIEDWLTDVKPCEVKLKLKMKMEAQGRCPLTLTSSPSTLTALVRLSLLALQVLINNGLGTSLPTTYWLSQATLSSKLTPFARTNATSTRLSLTMDWKKRLSWTERLRVWTTAIGLKLTS